MLYNYTSVLENVLAPIELAFLLCHLYSIKVP